MHPVNKEFISPDELRKQAATLRRTARSPAFIALGAAVIAGLLGRARSMDSRAAAELEEDAQYLERMRADLPPATTANPYREPLRA